MKIKDLLKILWKRTGQQRWSIFGYGCLEALLTVASVFVPLLAWIPLLEALFLQQFVRALYLIIMFLTIGFGLDVLAQFISSYRLKLALYCNQTLRFQLSQIAMDVSYDEFCSGQIQGEVQKANDILSYEFDYADAIDSLVGVLKRIFSLIMSLGIILSVVMAKVTTPLIGDFENSIWFGILSCVLFGLPLLVSVYVSQRAKRTLRSSLKAKMVEHVEIEKHFAYYRNEIVYRYDLYSMIQLFGFNTLLKNRIMDNTKINQAFFKNLRILTNRTNLVATFLIGINTIIVFLFVSYKMLAGAVAAATFLTVFLSVQVFYNSVFGLLEEIGDLKIKMTYLEQIEATLDIGQDEVLGSLKQLPNGSGWVLHNVTYRYPNASSDALSQINLELSEDGVHALVGENGSGKTTLILLLSGLLMPSEGEIRFRGIPLADWDREAYLEEIGVIFQDSDLFPISLEENMSFSANEFSQNSADLINNLATWGIASAKTESWLQENNLQDLNLSGGEKNKLLIFRIFASSRKNIFCDEPSAALDATSEKQLYELIYNQHTAKRMVFFVSHRLSACQNCQDILVMDKGKIISRGSHDELLQSSTKYQAMWNAQCSLYS